MIVFVASVVVVGGVGWALLRDDGEPRRPGPRDVMGTEFTTDDPTPEEVAAALRFGHLELPPDADVLRLAAFDSIDEAYQLLVAVAPGSEADLLRGSAFTAEFAPAEFPEDHTVTGADVPDDIASVVASDDVESNGTVLVYREIMIDRSDPNRTLLHINTFGN